MDFYAFRPTAEGKEPMGTQDRMVIRGLKTFRGAYDRAASVYGSDFRMYSFTNFYDYNTFKLVSNPSCKPIVGKPSGGEL